MRLLVVLLAFAVLFAGYGAYNLLRIERSGAIYQMSEGG